MPTLSVIIPVLNGARYLPRCLEAMRQSETAPLECIVVDDGSRDESHAIAEAAGATVLRTTGHAGPAAGRNLGAANAAGDILVFVDADVCVHRETLGLIEARLEADPTIGALFGSYDDEPGDPGFVSQYKNLQHHYVHQQGHEEAPTFWSGCGAVRRSVFLCAGGFDEDHGDATIEDVELGYRLRARGERIVLDRRIQAKHLKHWGLIGLVRCDMFDRALPWTLLILRSSRLPNDLNLARSQRLAATLVLAAGGVAAASIFTPITPLWAVAPLAAAILINRHFYSFLARKRGWLFLAGAIPLHLAYYVYSAAAFAMGVALYFLVWRWRGRVGGRETGSRAVSEKRR